MRLSLKGLLPGSGKVDGIFMGVVEDNKDPDKRARARIRVFGLHTHIKQVSDTIGITTESLPWAEPVLSLFGGSLSGYGVWSVPVQGSQVYLFFEGGNVLQPRYFATVSGVPKKGPNTSFGFSDPAGKYPKTELLNEPDVNRLARDITTNTVVEKRKTGRTLGIKTADSGTWDEPEPYYFESTLKYPDNFVIATHGGFVFEIDNKENFQRFSFYHPADTYFEVSKDGNVVFKNKKDRFDLTMGKERKYVKESQEITVEGKRTKAVAGADIETVLDTKTSLIDKSEIKYVKSGEQTIYVDGKQNIHSTSNQTISTKRNQEIGVWGNQNQTVKGSVNVYTLGYNSDSTTGIYTKIVTGIKIEQATPPQIVSSDSMLCLGNGPFSKAVNSGNSALSGISGAIRNALQPIYNLVNGVQVTVASTVATIVNFINKVTKPVTDLINIANSAINYVKLEMTAAQQLVTMPATLASTISGYANQLVTTPGMAMNNIISQITAAPYQLNLIRSLGTLYMNANSLTTMNIQGGMSTYNTLLSSLFSTQSSMPLGSLSNYPRSGIDSYSLVDDGTGTGNKRRQRQVITPQKYYITESQIAPSASISMSMLLGEGSLLDEIEEMDLFVSDSLCASFIDMDGNFYINKAIEDICNQANCYQYLLEVATINDLKDGLIYVDPGVLSRMGGIIKAPLLDDGYLTTGQYEYTIPAILLFSSIPLSARGNLWPYLDASWSVSTLYTSGAIDDATYLSLQYIDETDDEFSARMATQTSYSLLSSTIAPEIITVLDTTKTYIQAYANTVSAELSASLVGLFDTLIAGEAEILAIASQISLDNIDWDGKYDDYPAPPA